MWGRKFGGTDHWPDASKQYQSQIPPRFFQIDWQAPKARETASIA
jgi:hypothetical protein